MQNLVAAEGVGNKKMCIMGNGKLLFKQRGVYYQV